MKVLDLAGAQRMWNAMTQRIAATSGGGGAILEDVTLQQTIGVCPAGTTFAAGTPVETVLRRLCVRPNGRVFACSLETTSAHIDTGLTMDYGYKFRAVGRTPEGLASVLLGAYTSNSERTTLRMMGGGNAIQHMWPGNTQLAYADTGITPREIFEYVQDKDGVTITQGELTHTATVAGTQSGTGAAAIHLLQESNDTTRGNGILREAQIWDADGALLRDFHPWYLNGEVVMLDEANDNQIYRPSAGGLVEVTA